jgi:hypothetical protein
MYFLQVIMAKIFDIFHKSPKPPLISRSLYLILTERREYQKIVYYINKKPDSILNNS